MSDGNRDHINEEFNEFGENLKNAFNAAWQSEERQKAQQEIEAGIDHLGKALNEFVASFSASEAGQQMKEEFDDFGERLRSGEVGEKARQELLKALKALNQGLENATERFSADKNE